MGEQIYFDIYKMKATVIYYESNQRLTVTVGRFIERLCVVIERMRWHIERLCGVVERMQWPIEHLRGVIERMWRPIEHLRGVIERTR